MKRFSYTSAQDLHNHILSVVAGGDMDEYDVFIEEDTMEIIVVNRSTGVGEGIDAGKICYRADE